MLDLRRPRQPSVFYRNRSHATSDRAASTLATCLLMPSSMCRECASVCPKCRKSSLSSPRYRRRTLEGLLWFASKGCPRPERDQFDETRRSDAGGFYSHFESHDALVIEAFALAMDRTVSSWFELTQGEPVEQQFDGIVEAYLSHFHRDNHERGCALPALGMMIWEPQRAVFLRQRRPLSSREIAKRAKICAGLFLEGCKTKAPAANITARDM